MRSLAVNKVSPSKFISFYRWIIANQKKESHIRKNPGRVLPFIEQVSFIFISQRRKVVYTLLQLGLETISLYLNQVFEFGILPHNPLRNSTVRRVTSSNSWSSVIAWDEFSIQYSIFRDDLTFLRMISPASAATVVSLRPWKIRIG